MTAKATQGSLDVIRRMLGFVAAVFNRHAQYLAVSKNDGLGG